MALGALLACIVLAYGYSDGGGLDGPCLGSQWSRRVAQEGDYIASRSSNGLPGVRCVVTDYETGDVIAERVFPGGWTWGGAVAISLLPVALVAARRRTGRASPPLLL